MSDIIRSYLFNRHPFGFQKVHYHRDYFRSEARGRLDWLSAIRECERSKYGSCVARVEDRI